MNQEKVGKFILKLRKEKGMTQQELADKLNVTDRAVSHWENGRSLPDVSLFKPLCEVFEISVNELISGEKLSKDKLIKKSDENIINTISNSNNQKRKAKIIIISLCFIMLILLVVALLSYRSKYPKIDLYHFSVQNNEKMNLEKKVKVNSSNIYYYGLDYALFCDKEDNCYQVSEALKHKQIALDDFMSYLDKQVEYENFKVMVMWDGGTTVYKRSGIEVIYCNGIDGNRDIYIGDDKMDENLKGNYCGHEGSNQKTFTRTYYIISATEDNDKDYIDVTLKQFQGDPEVVKIDKSANISVGRNYEFTFLTYSKFDDNIKNIFNNSSILKIVETNKKGLEQINERINVNDNIGRDILPGDVNYYYTFTGESKHLLLEKGIADYRDNKAEFLVTNFKSKNNESFTGTLTISFDGKEMGSGEINNQSIRTLELGEYARKIKRADNGTFYGEIDSFMLTNPDDLPKALKITVKYCDSKNKCNDEEFKLSFAKHK